MLTNSYVYRNGDISFQIKCYGYEHYVIQFCPYRTDNALHKGIQLGKTATGVKNDVLSLRAMKVCKNKFADNYVVKVANIVMDDIKIIRQYFLQRVGV